MNVVVQAFRPARRATHTCGPGSLHHKAMTTLSARLLTVPPRKPQQPPPTLRKWVRRRVRRCQYAWAERCLRRLGLLEAFAHRPADACPPDYADLWYLYRLVRHRRPACVLEFGAGCSTLVIARALRDNHRAAVARDPFDNRRRLPKLVSVDSEPQWAEAAWRQLPPDLLPYASVSHVPLVECEHAGVPGFWYHPAGLPDVRPDLVYLDGPALTPTRKVAFNPLDLETRVDPGCLMVVDGRFDQQAFLRAHLRRRWTYRQNRLLVNAEFRLAA